MQKVILFILLAVKHLQCTQSALANPGLQIAVTAKGLDYVADVGIPKLVEELKTTTIPNTSGRADTPVGHISYDLSNIKIGSFAIPKYSFTSGSSGLDLKTSGIHVSIHANWHYREDSWPHISDSGSADISMSSSTLDLSVLLGRDSSNHMTLKASGCSVNIGSLSIDFHGGASWLYNLFNDQIASSIKGSLSGSICDTAVKYIDTSGNAAIESIPFVSKLDSTAEINYELFSDPLFESAYFRTQHKGEFYSIAHPVEAPCNTPAIPPASAVDDSHMLYLWVSTFVPNSAAFVYQDAGILTYNITPNTSIVPPGISMNTDFFGAFIPQLSKKYPHRPMEFDVTAGKYPTCTVSNNTIAFDVPGSLVAMVLLPNNTMVTVFTLDMVVRTTANTTITLKNGTEILGFEDTLLSIDLKLISSEIGMFDVNTLQKTVQLIATYIMIPVINQYGTTGIPIPAVEGVSFVNPEITLGANYIQVATDINYKPTTFV